MALQRLDLNLVPAPTLWERRHVRLGWGALSAGLAVLLGALGVSGWTYWQARRASVAAQRLNVNARKAALEQQRLQAQLADIDVGRELPRWRTAERVLQERALPWSRLIAELEMDLPDGMRLRSIQRLRGREGVTMKLKGEAQTRDSEEAFINALRANPVFSALALERENERQGGGLELELTLTAAAVPPTFAARPHPVAKAQAQAASSAAPLKPAVAPAPAGKAPGISTRTKPAPAPPAASSPSPRPQRPAPQDRPGPMPMRGARPSRQEAP